MTNRQEWLHLMDEAMYFNARGAYVSAIVKCEAALALVDGLSAAEEATTLNNLAGFYKARGLYKRAEELYLHTVEIGKAALGEDHPDVATFLNNLAELYREQGVYNRAEPLYLHSLEIRKKSLGQDHLDVAVSLNNLALLYLSKGLYVRAEPLCLRSLEIREQSRHKDHLDVSTGLNTLAGLYLGKGLYDRAEPLFLRALKIREKALNNDHPSIANILNNLATLYGSKRLYDRAESLYLRVLQIKEKALIEEHPNVVTTLNNLAVSYVAQGLYDRALTDFQTSLERQYNFLRDRLPHISQSEHQLYLKDLKNTLKALLSLVYRHLQTDQNAIAIALDALLLTKNLSAAALVTRNVSVHSGNPQLKTKNQEIQKLIARSNHLAYNDPQQAEIRNQILAIEIEIRHIAPEVILSDMLEVDRQAIALKLPPDSSLVEFIGFEVVGFDDKPWEPARYLAFVYSPDRTDEIRLIDLGLTSEIDMLITSCRRSIVDIYRKLVKTAEPGIPDEIEEFPLESLDPVRARIIEPLQLAGVSHAIIAVDGALSFLPFQLFLPDCLISYLNTGRDLVTKPSQKPAGDSIVIADPDFVNKPTELQLVPNQPQIQADGRQVAGVKDFNNWTRLESFGILGRSIAQKLQAPYYKQQKATKAKLTQAQCPHILSILTHGFSLPKTDADELDPMARSGLAFAGANHGAEYLLLANEVATLDLHANELTLLVACQTALGDTSAGEGVYGLRRAFALAGAKTLIATLWEIPVYASVILIERFLDNLERYMGKAAALKEAQLYLRDITVAEANQMDAGKKALAELHGSNYQLDDDMQPFAHPWFWAAWICQGDTGAMKYVVAKDLGKVSVEGKVVNLRIKK